MSAFKEGDVVILKSHWAKPLPMVVETGLRGDGMITVVWSDQWRRVHRDAFQPECLEIFKP